MKAVILAAGQGTRLKKYTKGLPKGMLVFQGKTIIERQVGLYRACGVDDITIVRGYAADKINYPGVKYYTNAEYARTNMVESFMAARGEFGSDVILSYSDILFTKAMLQAMLASRHDFSVAVDRGWEKYWMVRYGRTDYDTESLVLDHDNNNILSIGKENPPASEIDARYIGLLKFSQKALGIVTALWDKDYRDYQDRPWQQSGKAIRQAYMTDLLNALIKEGNQVKAVEFDNGWIEFDTNEDYESACRWAQDGGLDAILGQGGWDG